MASSLTTVSLRTTRDRLIEAITAIHDDALDMSLGDGALAVSVSRLQPAYEAATTAFFQAVLDAADIPDKVHPDDLDNVFAVLSLAAERNAENDPEAYDPRADVETNYRSMRGFA